MSSSMPSGAGMPALLPRSAALRSLQRATVSPQRSASRLAVLSDDADRWGETVARWSERNAALRGSSAGMPAPDGIDELMLYQTLVGAWPLLGMDDAGTRAQFQERIAQWWTKALREAKRHTSWIA